LVSDDGTDGIANTREKTEKAGGGRVAGRIVPAFVAILRRLARAINGLPL
jgi:hypothetical protein